MNEQREDKIMQKVGRDNKQGNWKIGGLQKNCSLKHPAESIAREFPRMIAMEIRWKR